MNLVKFTLSMLLLLAFNAQAKDAMEYGRAYMAEGDHAAAAQSYSEALKINPFDPVAHNNLAVAKAAQGDYQTAMDLLVRAVKLAPKRQDIRDNLNRMQSWMSQDNSVHRQQVAVPVRPKRAELPELPALWGSPAARVAVEIRPQLKMIKQLRFAPVIYR